MTNEKEIYEKKILDAITIIGLCVMLGPVIYMLIIGILAHGASPQPPNLDRNDYTVITFVGGMFSFTGLIMLAYVVTIKTIKWAKKQTSSGKTSQNTSETD